MLLYLIPLVRKAKRNEELGTHDASISAVKSVSGFSVDVLNFGPFFTVNHMSFLCRPISCALLQGTLLNNLLLDDELSLLEFG
jgi:hypothetical protein